MAITRAEKAAYNDYIKEFKSELDEIGNEIRGLEIKKRKMPAIAPYFNFEMVLKNLKRITLYVNISDASLEMLHIKNEAFLNNARKEVYKILQYMEETVGTVIDKSLKENEDYLERIDKINPRQILSIIQAIQGSVQKLIDRFGDASKWKWSFVDIQGRVAVIIKNIINFSDMQKHRDPRAEYYRERQELLKMCKKNLNESAKQFRTKYEISTQAPGDILKSIELLSVLRRIDVLFGESGEASKLKNTIDALRARLDSEEKKKEKKTKGKK